MTGGENMRSLFKSLLFLPVLLAPPVSAQSVKVGIEAWQQGDAAKAVAIWRPLATQGNADAAFNLGQAYRLGKGVPISLGEAQKWLEIAARKDHVDAQTTLGLLLFNTGNRVSAMRWLSSAADAGEPRAMLMLGTALYNGDGVAEDPVRAYAYVSRAAATGLAPAKATLADMDQAMPLSQRQKGVALAQQMVLKGSKPPASAKPKPAPVAQAARPAPKPAAPTPVASASGGWRIQLGAFSQRTSAEALFAKLEPKLGGRQAYFVPVGKVIRLQAGPFPSKSAASAGCAAVRPTPCFPVPGR